MLVSMYFVLTGSFREAMGFIEGRKLNGTVWGALH